MKKGFKPRSMQWSGKNFGLFVKSKKKTIPIFKLKKTNFPKKLPNTIKPKYSKFNKIRNNGSI